MRECPRLRGALLLGLTLVPSIAHAGGLTFPSDDVYRVVLCEGRSSIDPAGDVVDVNAALDIVGDAGAPALAIADDGTYMFLRLRVDADPTNGGALVDGGWGFLLDIDGNLATYEVSLIVDTIAEPPEVRLSRNDVAVPGNPGDEPESTVISSPVDALLRTDLAGSDLGGGADYFVVVAVARADLEAAGVSLTSATVVWAGTSTNGHGLQGDIACHDGATGAAVLDRIAPDPVVLDVALDPDGDGLTNDEEEGIGTDPDDGDSDGDGLGDGHELRRTLTDPAEADSDGDGLDDGDELARGLDPNFVDSDRGGADDGDEVAAGTDPGNPDDDAPDDADGDGLTNRAEYELGTNRDDDDTDDDGLLDGAEVEGGTDPLRADTDEDTLGDGAEIELGTDPTLADSDGDGLDDGDEVDRETDPTLADTDGGGVDDGAEVDAGTDPLDGEDDVPPPDTDGDGSPDPDDNCPDDANADQLDADADGIGDACDTGSDDDDSGCECALGPRSGGARAPAGWLMALAVVACAWRRRRVGPH